MTVTDLIAALDLPPSCRVDQRVPKKLVIENGAPTAADKRHINDGIEDLHWIAALKPTTVGLPDYRNEVREYLEVAVLSLELRPGAKIGRLTELVHRAVPYPVVLITEQHPELTFSLAHKRWSQGEAGVTVLDGEVFIVALDKVTNAALLTAFAEALPLTSQPRVSLYALYQGWIDTVLALRAACLNGTFAMPASAEQADARRQALQEIALIESEMARIRSAAAKEKQVPRRVELNIELKRREAVLTAARARL